MWKPLRDGALQAGLGLLAFMIPLAFPQLPQWVTGAGIVVGLLLVLWRLLSFVRHKNKSPALPPAESKENNQIGDKYVNNGSNIGHMGPINNFGPQRFSFDAAAQQQLRSKLSTKKNVHLVSVGTAQDQIIGDAVEVYIRSLGFSVDRARYGMMAPPPDEKIEVRDAGEEYSVIVAPRA